MLYYGILCYVMLCYVMLVVLCYVMSYEKMIDSVKLFHKIVYYSIFLYRLVS